MSSLNLHIRVNLTLKSIYSSSDSGFGNNLDSNSKFMTTMFLKRNYMALLKISIRKKYGNKLQDQSV